MSNDLFRTGNRLYTEPVSYRAPAPGYTYFVRRSGYRPVSPTPGFVWGYDPRAVISNYFAGPAPWLKYFEWDEPVVVAPVTERAAVTGGWYETSPPGWNSFAHSAARLPGSGTGTWRVPVGATGVVVGLSASPVAPTPGYGHIAHGMRFQAGTVYSVRTGANLGAYTSGSVMGIVATLDKVTLKRDATVLATEDTALPNAPLALAAVMYALGDQVNAPTLSSTFDGAAEMTLPAMEMSAYTGAIGDAQMTLPALTMDASAEGVMALPALRMFAADNDGAYADMQLPALMLDGTNLPPPPIQPVADMVLPALVLSAQGLTGEVAQAAMLLPSMRMIAADYDYADAQMVLPALQMSGYELETIEVFMPELMVLDVGFSAQAVDSAAFAVGLVMDVDFAVTLVQLVPLDFGMVLDVGFAVDQVSTVEIRIGMLFDIPMAVPGADVDVWAVNLATEGSTSYTNYPFNSFARIGQRYYGAGEGGIFELDGDNDAGTQIDAAISLGAKDFGSAQRKSIIECFLAMAGDGPLVLLLQAEGNAFAYRTASYSEHMQLQRVKPGKGRALQGNYITPVIYNSDGSNFELDSLQFEVADLQRKL